MIVEFLEFCLKQADYEVYTAFGGHDGCDLAKKTKPDLIILDLLMPDMHGFDVCQKIRRDRSLRGTKILVSTGKGYAVDEKAARRLGAQGYLIKPYSTDKLLETVQEMVGLP